MDDRKPLSIILYIIDTSMHRLFVIVVNLVCHLFGLRKVCLRVYYYVVALNSFITVAFFQICVLPNEFITICIQASVQSPPRSAWLLDFLLA